MCASLEENKLSIKSLALRNVQLDGGLERVKDILAGMENLQVFYSDMDNFEREMLNSIFMTSGWVLYDSLVLLTPREGVSERVYLGVLWHKNRFVTG